MTTPTDEKLISQERSQIGVREPGSLIEERVRAAEMANQKISLGHVERTCLRCGKDWGNDVSTVLCPKCGYNECLTKEVPPTPVVLKEWGTGLHTTIIGTMVSEEAVKTPLSVTETELDSLRSLRVAIVVLEEHLQSADQHLHQLVDRSDVNREIFSFIQQAVHGLWDAHLGDYELRAVDAVTAISLKGPLKALREELDRVIARAEREAAKK